MQRRRLAVLISGSGSNLQAIINAIAAETLPVELSVVVSNQPHAFGLQRARFAGIPTKVVPMLANEGRAEYDIRLAEQLSRYQPDLIVLAGWMRILSNKFITQFPNRIINLHPALPGDFPGLHSIKRAFDESVRGERDHTGVMVHLVPDEGVDDGPVLATARVPINPDDTLATLERRVHLTEHRLLVDTLSAIATSSTFPPKPPTTAPNPPT